jgi:hypothetical protein
VTILATSAPGPLADSLVLVGFDAVRRSAEGAAPPVASLAAPAPISQRVSLLGDVPFAAVFDPGQNLAVRLGVLGRLPAGYGRDGPALGHLRREATAPFRL